MTWARGLLEERIEHTGALALVLTALCRELERPVALGTGEDAAASATSELDADTCGIRLRGPRAVVREAVRRLPSLCTRPLIADGLRPRWSPAPL